MGFLKNLFSKGKSSQPQILLEERSPLCPITAIVEQDEEVAYLYLWADQNPGFGVGGTKACWIRNLKPAPPKIIHSKSNPRAPMMPASGCKSKDGLPPLRRENLRLVWFEEGDSVALLEGEKILAVIPSWGGLQGFPGYADDAFGSETALAWEFQEENVLPGRVKASEAVWKAWETRENPFHEHQPTILAAYDEIFGSSEKYFAIDGEKFPPRGLYAKNGPNKTVLATVGMSFFPMPMVEMFVEDRFSAHRIEIGLLLNGSFSEAELKDLGSQMSGPAGLPWEYITFLAEFHTFNIQFPGNGFMQNAMLVSSTPFHPVVELDSFGNSATNFLWAIPISERERQWAMDKGGEVLLKKLLDSGEHLLDLNRKEIL